MLTEAVRYGQVLFAGALLVWLINTLASIVRGTGNMRAPSVALVATAVLQIALGGVLALGAGPVPAMGMVAPVGGVLSILSEEIDRADPAFALWVDRQVAAHKQRGYAIVNISLKPLTGIPGDASAEQIELVASLAEQYSLDELRVTHAQNLVLPLVKKVDLYAIWQKLDEAGLAEANLDLITDIIACPGLDYCALANARSIPLAQKIAQRFADNARQAELGELKLKISGCINACGHHHAGHIGILGVDRKGVENFQLLLGGSGAEDASLGQITGPGFSEDGVVDAIEKVTDIYLAERTDGERFLDTYRRIGMKPFKEAIYG